MTDRLLLRRSIRRSSRRAIVLLTAMTAMTASCDESRPDEPIPAALETILVGRDAPATDVFEVWVCGVPAGTSDPVFAPTADRLSVTAEAVVERIGGGLTGYWATVSNSAYRPTFVAGGAFDVGPADSSQACVERALAGSGPQADAVLVVATAQHASDQPGGRSTPGSWTSCTGTCSAAETGRYVYVGANDFQGGPDQPVPLDLIEHEIGHSLGLPHSGDVVGAEGNRGVGPYAVMADPAAPRDVDPTRRDAPDLLAIDRLDLGWLPLSAVHVVESNESVQVAQSNGRSGTRLAIIAVDEHRLLTIELLPDSGYDDHLPEAGVVVHLVSDSPEQCGATTRCTDLGRVQQVVAATDSDRTLLRAGDLVTIAGWTIGVESIVDGTATVTVTS